MAGTSLIQLAMNMTTIMGFIILAVPSALAGSLTIDQQSSMPLKGSWQLSMPNNNSVISNSKEASRTVSLSKNGLHTLNVRPPEGASTFITLSDSSGKLQSITGKTLRATLDSNNDYRAIIRYDFNSIITVNSTPSGVPFELTGPPKGIQLSGVTPAVFKDLPPYYYTVHYGVIDGCLEPKPQKREVPAHQHITFNAEYTCELPKQDVPDGTLPDEPLSDAKGLVSMWLTPHQIETLPGESITYTLAVKNHSKRTQHNLEAAFQFDVAKMRISKMLPKNGTVIAGVAKWNIPTLYAGQTWKIEFPVEIRDTIDEGVRIGTSARVSGPEINVLISDKLSANTTVGTASIPRTGGASDVIMLIVSMTATLILMQIKRYTQQ